jgi:uncharacterized protein YdaL
MRVTSVALRLAVALFAATFSFSCPAQAADQRPNDGLRIVVEYRLLDAKPRIGHAYLSLPVESFGKEGNRVRRSAAAEISCVPNAGA